MKSITLTTLVLMGAFLTGCATRPSPPVPLRALLITGGCCHDYDRQKLILSEGISARANVTWDTIQEGGRTTNHKISIYTNANWAKNYDVIVHNECFADVADDTLIRNVLNAHSNGVAAVVIHCTMHTFRAFKSEDWHNFLGVTTKSHGPQHPLEIRNLAPRHPVMKGFPEMWKTGNEELYAIDKVWPGATPLAQAYAIDRKKDMTCIWVNQFGKGRVFGTTVGHNNVTMQDPIYLDLITRGLLWSCGKLNEDGTAQKGFGTAQPVRPAH